MAHYLLSAEVSFSAAHTLPGVNACSRMHGHDWRVQITVRVEEGQLGEGAMGVDFRELERVIHESVEAFDHRYLNELEPFRDHPPTAERLAHVVCDRAAQRLAEVAPHASVEELALWETPQYKVIYRP